MSDDYVDVAKSERHTLVRFASGLTPPGLGPVNTVLPVISGTPTVGQTISTTNGTWTASPTPTYTYQWKRAGASIGGATASTYTLVALDTAALITVTVTATNASGNASATSASFGTINSLPNNAVAPVASGSLTVGSVLSVTTGTWTGTPVPTYAYQWKRDTTNVGTNASTYTLVTADIGAMMSCVVTGTNTAGSASATSNALGPVTAAAVSGGDGLLTGEANGFATDFLHPVDAERVALKTSGSSVAYAVDAFYANASTSPKMVYDVAGTLGWSAHNYCLRSDDMSNASWTKTAGTATAGQFTEDTSSGNHQVSCNVSSLATGIPYSVRVRVRKSGSRNFVVLQFYDGGSINYGVSLNLNTGATAIQFGSPTNITATPTGTANEYDFFYTASTNSGAISLFLWASSDGTITAYTGDGVSGFFASRWQIYRDATALAYLPTTTAARVGLALEYDPVTHVARGMRCEIQATNLLLNNATLSTQSVTVAGTANTLSFFGTGTVTLSGVSTAGPLTGTGANNRVSLTFTPTAGTLTLTVSGSVTKGQLETGIFATSPIPTLGATVTRAGDKYNINPASINNSGTAGSWWVDFSLLVSNGGVNSGVMGVATNGYLMFYDETTRFGQWGDAGVNHTASIASSVGLHKVATAFTSSDCAFTVDGLAVTTVGGQPSFLSPGTLYFGSNASGGANITGYIRKLRYVPRRKSNAELQTETA